MSTPEGQIKIVCRKYLREKGCYLFSPVQVGYGAPTLDDLVCWRGRFLGIEYKIPGKDMTSRQEKTTCQMTAAGAIVVTVHSLPELVEFMEMLETGASRL